MGRARGANARMHFAFETSYGVPPVAGNYIQMPFVSSQLGAEQGLIDSDLLGQQRAPFDPIYDVVTNDGDVVGPLDNNRLGTWLKLLLGPAVTTLDSPTTGVNQHVFTSGAAALPSASIEIANPDRPAFSTNYGVRANTLQIQMQRSGLTSATIGLIGKGETVLATTSSAGSVPAMAQPARFPAARGAISADGATLGEVLTANVSYSNGLDKDETIRPDGEINDVDPGMPSASVELTTKFADLALYNKATSGTPVGIALQWVLGTHYLNINLPRVFLPRVKRPITGPGGIQATFRAMASSSSGATLVATLINDVAAYA